MIYWALGFFTSIASLSVYLEYASYFPNRSGSEVVYLEQAYPRPRWFFPTAFAVQTVILSFSSSNAIGERSRKWNLVFWTPEADKFLQVLAQYLFRINGHVPTDWQLKGVAIAGYTVATLCKLYQYTRCPLAQCLTVRQSSSSTPSSRTGSRTPSALSKS